MQAALDQGEIPKKIKAIPSNILIKELPTLKTISIKYLFQYPEAFKSSRSDISKTSLFEDRKKILMNKTNSELKNLLKGVANISRLKKVQLVEKILYLELDL